MKICKLKIGIILGDFSIGKRLLDFNNLWTSTRGLTGTDLAFVRVAEEFQKLGHEVELFTACSTPIGLYHGMRIRSTADIVKIDNEKFDAVINFNEPNLFIGMEKPFKLLYMMLNDFSFVLPEFDQWTDHYVGVCQEHTNYVANNSNTNGKWSVVPLGCDPDKYKDKRIPGKVIWCSSADRGLHWLLSQWSTIKCAVPNAFLKIFYHFSYIDLEKVEDNQTHHPHVTEMAQRIRYIKKAVKELAHLDVEHVGSVSRERMQTEFSEASVFGFPCDTVAFSEGFSVSTLEAHASHTVPVITDADCLGGIYQNSGCVMVNDIKDNLDIFTQKMIQALTDQEFANQKIKKSREFAKQHTWTQTAQQLETIIKESWKLKNNAK